MHPTRSTALAAVTAARHPSQVNPSGSGAPELPTPLSRARHAELVQMMAERNLDCTDLTVPQMRETLRQADPSRVPHMEKAQVDRPAFLSKALRSDLLHRMAALGLCSDGLAKNQMRETIRRADPNAARCARRGIPGLRNVRKPELLHMATAKGITTSGLSVEQLRLKLADWEPTVLRGSSGSIPAPRPTPSTTPAAFPRTLFCSCDDEEDTVPYDA